LVQADLIVSQGLRAFLAVAQRLARAIEREKAAENAPPDPRRPTAAEEAAATRAILSKRTFIQNVFAHLGPRLRSERRG
jgi:hypothetical protein